MMELLLLERQPGQAGPLSGGWTTGKFRIIGADVHPQDVKTVNNSRNGIAYIKNAVKED